MRRARGITLDNGILINASLLGPLDLEKSQALLIYLCTHDPKTFLTEPWQYQL